MFILFIKGCNCSKPACFNYRIKAFHFSSRCLNSWSEASFSLQSGSGGTQSAGSAQTGSSQHRCNTCAPTDTSDISSIARGQIQSLISKQPQTLWEDAVDSDVQN